MSKLTDTATARTKANLSRLHLQSARLFLSQCEDIASKESSMEWPQPHWDQSRSYAGGAVVLAVAALEASINELFLEAVDKNTNSLSALTADQQSLLGTIWEEVEGFSILKKYEVVLSVCGKVAMDRSAEPYQSAAALVALRNALVHFKPEWDNELDSHSRLEQRLRAWFLDCALASQARGRMIWFPHKCLGVGCARWAIDSVIRFVSDFCFRLGIADRFV